jgi:tripartite-type tricarboxylate transporter receptor subunit TctC
MPEFSCKHARHPEKTYGYLLFLLAAMASAAMPVAAQNYPTRTIRLVVPSAPGGGTDILGRVLAHKLTEYLGQQVVVDNRAGAGTTIGIDNVAKSAPDGYTVLVSPSTLALNVWMYAKLPYDAMRDLAPLTQIAAVPNALVVHPSVPARSVAELVALAKKQPGEINVGSAGIGTSPHLSLELLKHLAKINLVHVPYKGSGAAVIAHLAGEISAQIPSLPTAMGYIRTNRLRALGVTTVKRSPFLPQVPAIGETVAGYEATQWFGFLTTAGTPQAVLDRLSQEAVRALRAPDVVKQLSNEGAEIVAGTPVQFGALIKAETEKWGRVIKAAGIKPQ